MMAHKTHRDCCFDTARGYLLESIKCKGINKLSSFTVEFIVPQHLQTISFVYVDKDNATVTSKAYQFISINSITFGLDINFLLFNH